jgi:hypothetical protein
MLGTVGIFKFRQDCQHSLRSAVYFPYWTYSNLFNSPDARYCWDFLNFAKTASTHFVRLSASRTGLTQTFSTVPMLGTVGIFYFFVNSSKLDLLFNKKSFQLR